MGGSGVDMRTQQSNISASLDCPSTWHSGRAQERFLVNTVDSCLLPFLPPTLLFAFPKNFSYLRVHPAPPVLIFRSDSSFFLSRSVIVILGARCFSSLHLFGSIPSGGAIPCLGTSSAWISPPALRLIPTFQSLDIFSIFSVVIVSSSRFHHSLYSGGCQRCTGFHQCWHSAANIPNT